MCLHPNTM